MSPVKTRSLLDKVLIPLDGSFLAAAILKQLSRLLRRPETAVRFVTVLNETAIQEARAQGGDAFGPALKQLEREMEALDPRDGVSWDAYVGDPAARIVQDAVEENVTLIALATHGRTGIERLVRGSVAEQILRTSPVPVIVSNLRGLLSEVEIRRILVPLDGSATSAIVLANAAELARLYGAEIILFYVVDSPIHPDRPISAVETPDFVAWRESLRGLRVLTLSATGSPAEEILRAAERERVDLIALTTHGRSGLSRLAFGSVAEQVVRQSPVPLLVQRIVKAASE
jgi:nucleotide-binding universal stress UspA family protein